MPALKPVTPGELLVEEFLVPMQLSQYRLAKEIGVPAQRIGEIVAERRAITADTDLRLCRLVGLSACYWLRAQAAHDTPSGGQGARARASANQALGECGTPATRAPAAPAPHDRKRCSCAGSLDATHWRRAWHSTGNAASNRIRLCKSSSFENDESHHTTAQTGTPA